jgi:hypothetical protein
MHQSNPYLSHTVTDCLGDACSSVGVVTQESNNIVTSLCQFDILIVVVSTLVVLWGGVTVVGLVTHQVMVVTHVHMDPQLHTHTHPCVKHPELLCHIYGAAECVDALAENDIKFSRFKWR